MSLHCAATRSKLLNVFFFSKTCGLSWQYSWESNLSIFNNFCLLSSLSSTLVSSSFPCSTVLKLLALGVWIMGWWCGRGTHAVLPPKNRKVLALEDGRKTYPNHLIVLGGSRLDIEFLHFDGRTHSMCFPIHVPEVISKRRTVAYKLGFVRNTQWNSL